MDREVASLLNTSDTAHISELSVLTFVRYNANKALQNLGFDSLFSDTAEDVNPIVMNGLSTGTANHDFFSQVGNGYRVAPIESMSTEDYDY